MATRKRRSQGDGRPTTASRSRELTTDRPSATAAAADVGTSSSRDIQQNGSVNVQASNIFSEIVIRIIPSALGKSRLSLLKSLVLSHGGRLLSASDDDNVVLPSKGGGSPQVLIVADDSLPATTIDKIAAKADSACVTAIVKVSWICECMRQKRLVDFSAFQFPSKITPTSATNKDRQTTITATPVKRNRKTKDGGDQELSNDSTNDDHVGSQSQLSVATISSNIDSTRFACARPSTVEKVNYNEHITEKLELLAATFKTTQDRWRAVGYERAIAALKRHPKEIVSWEEAKSLPAVGDRLADKISEIIQSGRLRKMDEVTSDEKVIAMQLFANVWGIGPTTAQLLVQRGYRTLDDLAAADCLNRQQTIGLRHYADLLERMPRDEASEIERTVREASLAIQPDLVAITCGSYRRGKNNCGDVDVLVTHPDGKSHSGILHRIVSTLKQTGFLTDDLVTHEENGAQHKYMGVCRLPGNETKHRRLDIIVVPYSEFACSLLYFTGSAHFNRSMRLLARKKAMSLSEHSLNVGVIRRGQLRVYEGSQLPTPTERSVFEHLGLPYRSPEERDH